MGADASHEVGQPNRGPHISVPVALGPDHLYFLDATCIDLRYAGAGAVKRSDLVRALLDGVRASGLDLAGLGSLEAIRREIAIRLMQPPRADGTRVSR
jgi:hypothetical protein